jgi:hypothetical protein
MMMVCRRLDSDDRLNGDELTIIEPLLKTSQPHISLHSGGSLVLAASNTLRDSQGKQISNTNSAVRDSRPLSLMQQRYKARETRSVLTVC